MGTSVTNVTNTTAPWTGVQPYFNDLYKRASDTFGSQPKAPSTNYAPVTQDQRAALSGLGGVAQGFGALGTQYRAMQPTFTQAGQDQRQGVDAIRGLAGDTLGGKYLDHRSNPYLSDAVKAAQFDTFRNFNENVMPAIRGNSQLNGTYGGDRTDLVISRAMEGALSDAQRQANQIYMGNYEAERGRQMQSPQLYGQANAIDSTGLQTLIQGLNLGAQGQQYDLQGANLTGQIADQGQTWDQQAIDAGWDLWNRQTNELWDPISRFSQVLNGSGFNTQTSSTPRSSSIFQGAAGGGLLGSQLANQFGGDPRTLSLIMAALGGASGY